MISTRLQDYLSSSGVDYSVSIHRPGNTAKEIALHDHTPLRQMAKTVVFAADGVYGMALLPANTLIDPALLGESIGATELRLANEAELMRLFPDVEVGAMPPFANLWNPCLYRPASGQPARGGVQRWIARRSNPYEDARSDPALAWVGDAVRPEKPDHSRVVRYHDSESPHA